MTHPRDVIVRIMLLGVASVKEEEGDKCNLYLKVPGK
jgi:hypothetical protein